MTLTLSTQALGPLEAQIMHLLWRNGCMTVRSLHHAIAPNHDIAYTTVLTSIDRMYQKSLVPRQALDSHARAAYLYTAAVTRAELLVSAIEKMCADLGADAAELRHSVRRWLSEGVLRMYRTLFMQALGPTETAIMRLLWEQGPATVSELHKAIMQARPVSYSTVRTIAERLCKKGIVVRHTLEDRAYDPYCYTPTVTRVELIAAMIEKMCRDLGADSADRRAMYEVLG